MQNFPEGCSILFGASGALGQAIAAQLGSLGADQLLTYRSGAQTAESLRDALRSVGRGAEAIRCDVTEPASVERVFDEARSRFGGVHSIVFACGRPFKFSRIPEHEPNGFRDVMEADVFGFYNVVRAGLPILRKSGGAITAIGTSAVTRMVPGDSLSSIPKAAVAMIVRHIAAEEARHGIRANMVGPGIVDAGITLGFKGGGSGATTFEGMCNTVPMRRAGEAEEIGRVVAFVTSAQASYVNGQIIHVDGGWSA